MRACTTCFPTNQNAIQSNTTIGMTKRPNQTERQRAKIKSTIRGRVLGLQKPYEGELSNISDRRNIYIYKHIYIYQFGSFKQRRRRTHSMAKKLFVLYAPLYAVYFVCCSSHRKMRYTVLYAA